MRKLKYYHAAQVVRRDANGRIQEWFDGDKVADLSTAKKDRDQLAAQFPGYEYTVPIVTIEEIGTGKVWQSQAITK